MKLPPVLQDLWRDLRDKRLLPVVALLVVALFAVPVALGGGTEPAPEAGAVTAPGSASEAPEADPVVLADTPAIRDFNERLARFKRKNPFKQQFTGLPQSAQRALQEGDGTDGGDTNPFETPSTDGSDTPSGGDTGDDTSSTDGGSGGSGGDDIPNQLFLFSWEIDVKVGPVGDAKKRKNVRSGEFLPDKDLPVVMYLQGNHETGEALFLVSREISATTGDGRCTPTPVVCEFLVLKEGEEQRFDYVPDGESYRLKLSKVKLKREVVDPDEVTPGELSARTSAYADLMSRAGE